MSFFILEGSYCCKQRAFRWGKGFERDRGIEKTVAVLRELSEDWKENIAIVNSATREYGTTWESIKRLCRKNNQGNLVQIGLTLISFPLPIVIDDVLGLSFLAVGLFQKKIKSSALYLEDVNKTFPHLVKEVQEIRNKIV